MLTNNVSQLCHAKFVRDIFKDCKLEKTNSVISEELIRSNRRVHFIRLAINEEVRDLLLS